MIIHCSVRVMEALNLHSHDLWSSYHSVFIVKDNLHFKALQWCTGNKIFSKPKFRRWFEWQSSYIFNVPFSKYKCWVFICASFPNDLPNVVLVKRTVSLWVCFARSTYGGVIYLSVIETRCVTSNPCESTKFISKMPIWSFIWHWTKSLKNFK